MRGRILTRPRDKKKKLHPQSLAASLLKYPVTRNMLSGISDEEKDSE